MARSDRAVSATRLLKLEGDGVDGHLAHQHIAGDGDQRGGQQEWNGGDE